MAPKSLVLATALLVVVAAVGLAPHGAEAGASVSTSVSISGVVPCSAGSSIDVTAVPVFPNAGLQLVCSGKVVARTTADGTGTFRINLSNVATVHVTTVLLGNKCKVVVTTPLAACDASLAGVTGTLTAPLKLLGASTGTGSGDGLIDLGGIIAIVGQIVGGLIGGILKLAPQAFSLV